MKNTVGLSVLNVTVLIRKSTGGQFIIDDPLAGAHIMGYRCDKHKCGCKIIDYGESTIGPLYRELKEK